MATLYWVGGSGSQSWAAAANWSATRFGAGGAGVPAAGDTVYVIDGNSVIDQGLSQSAVSLLKLYILFNGSIGTASVPLHINTTGSGYETVIGGGVTEVNIAGNHRPRVSVNTGVVVRFSTGVLDDTQIGTNGRVEILASCQATPVYVYGASVRIEDNATPVAIFCYAGSVETYRAIDDCHIYSGVITAYNDVSVGDVCEVFANGIYNHQASGTIVLLKLYAGGIATSRRNSSPFTVTDAEVYGAGSLFENPPATITYTAAPRYFATR